MTRSVSFNNSVRFGFIRSFLIPIHWKDHIYKARPAWRPKGNARSFWDIDHVTGLAAHLLTAAGDDKLAFEHDVDLVVRERPLHLAFVERHVSGAHRRTILGDDHVLQPDIG